jgi:hypothetical protein
LNVAYFCSERDGPDVYVPTEFVLD